MSDLILVCRIIWKIACGFQFAAIMGAACFLVWLVIHITLRVMAASKRRDEMDARHRYEMKKARSEWAKGKSLEE